MASDPSCYGDRDFCLVRIALLNSSGQIVSGASNGWRTDAGIQLQVKPQIDSGDDEVIKNGCGVRALTFDDDDVVTGAELTLEVSTLEAGFLQLAINNSTFMQAGSVLGTQAAAVNLPGNFVCLEGWTKAWNGANQAGPDLLGVGGNPITNPNYAYHHWVYPKVRFHIGDWTNKHGFATFQLVGTAYENANMTGHGPFNDWPAGVIAAGGITRWYGEFYDATLPLTNCGFLTVPASSS